MSLEREVAPFSHPAVFYPCGCWPSDLGLGKREGCGLIFGHKPVKTVTELIDSVVDKSDPSREEWRLVWSDEVGDDMTLFAADEELLEPSFRPINIFQQKFSPGVWGERVADHLAYRIAHRKSDLEAHVHRIVLYYQLRESNAVYGALVDLFIVLNGQGTELRRRLLTSTASVLDETCLRILETWLERGPMTVDMLPESRYSMLTGNFIGTSSLAVKTEKDALPTQRDVLDEARDHMDSGLIQEAQRLLEEGILSEPHREDLSLDLLEVYRHTRDTNAFGAIISRLGGYPEVASDQWGDMSNFLKNNKL